MCFIYPFLCAAVHTYTHGYTQTCPHPLHTGEIKTLEKPYKLPDDLHGINKGAAAAAAALVCLGGSEEERDVRGGKYCL